MKNTQQGLTLIELMIVIAVIGILGALALPAYQDYTIRAKVSEMLLAADGCKTSVTEAISSSSDTNVAAQLPKACESQTSKYVSSIAVDGNGVITVTLTHPTADVQIGNLDIGMQEYVGRVQFAPTDDADNYSKITRSVIDGSATLTPSVSVPKTSQTILVEVFL